MDEFEPCLEDLLAQGHRVRRLCRRKRLAEVLEVLAEVEDLELILVLARPEEILSQPCASADHLPELGLRANELEEDEVHDFGYVDSGIEHVDREGDVRRPFRR